MKKKIIIFTFVFIIIVLFMFLIVPKNSINYSASINTAFKNIGESINKKMNVNVSKTSAKKVVFDNMTIDELSEKLNRSLKNKLSGKGNVIASKCIELGVDPYLTTAIMLHETGCFSRCSRIANECNNFGGQKGSGCGSYKRYSSVDEGIIGMINNLYKNYYSKGLTSVSLIGPKYAESSTWQSMINSYMNKIKNT